MRRFSRRESEILEILYAKEEASVAQVRAALDDPPSYDAVRTTLRILVEKDAAKRRSVDRKYIYAPRISERRAWKSFAKRLADMFFGGSMGNAALAMLRMSELDIDEAELRRLERRLGGERKNKDEDDG